MGLGFLGYVELPHMLWTGRTASRVYVGVQGLSKGVKIGYLVCQGS